MCISPPPTGRGSWTGTKYNLSEDEKQFEFGRKWNDGRIKTANGHKGSVTVTAIASGLVFSGSNDSTVRVWSATTGRCIALLSGHGGPVLSLAVSGSVLYSGSEDGAIRAWRLSDYVRISLVQCHRGPVWSLAVSSNGCHVYSGMDNGSIMTWSAPSGSSSLKLSHVLTAHRGPVYALAIGGDCLYSGAADRQIKVWLLHLQRQYSLGTACSSPQHVSPNSSMSFSSQFQHSPPLVSSPPYRPTLGPISLSNLTNSAASGGDLIKGLKPLTSQSRTRSAQDFTSAPSSPRFQPLDKLPDRPVPVAIFEGHSNEVLSLCFYGGILFSGDADGVVKVWLSWRQKPLLPEAKGPDGNYCFASLKSGGKYVRSLAVNGDALYIGGQGIEVWWWSEHRRNFVLERCWKVHSEHVLALAVGMGTLGEATLVSGGMDHDLRIWWTASPDRNMLDSKQAMLTKRAFNTADSKEDMAMKRASNADELCGFSRGLDLTRRASAVNEIRSLIGCRTEERQNRTSYYLC